MMFIRGGEQIFVLVFNIQGTKCPSIGARTIPTIQCIHNQDAPLSVSQTLHANAELAC